MSFFFDDKALDAWLERGGVEVERLVIDAPAAKLSEEITAAQAEPSPIVLQQRLVGRLVTEAFVLTHPDKFAQRVAEKQAYLGEYLRMQRKSGGASISTTTSSSSSSSSAATSVGDDETVALLPGAEELMMADIAAAMDSLQKKRSLLGWSSAAGARLRWRLNAAVHPHVRAKMHSALAFAKRETFAWAWDASTCGDNVTVTNNGSVAVLGDRSGSTTEGARGTKGFSNGVHRWTVEWLNEVGTHSSVGVCTSAHSMHIDTFDHVIGNDTVSWGWHSKSGNLFFDGSVIGTCDSWGQGDQIECILDCDEGTLTLLKNGERQGDDISGLEGLTLFPCVATPWYRGSMRIVKTEDSSRDTGAAPRDADTSTYERIASALDAVLPQTFSDTTSPRARIGSAAVAALQLLLQRIAIAYTTSEDSSDGTMGAAGAAAYVDLEAEDIRGDAAATSVAIMRALLAQEVSAASTFSPLSRFSPPQASSNALY
jgi:hypothetical protein